MVQCYFTKAHALMTDYEIHISLLHAGKIVNIYVLISSIRTVSLLLNDTLVLALFMHKKGYMN